MNGQDQFSRQEALAALAELSGDPVLGRFAGGMRERISERRKGLQRARERAEEANRLKPSGMPGFMIRGGEVVPMPGYDEYLEKQHQRGLRLAREKAKHRQGDQEWYARQMFLRTMGTPAQAAEARKTLAYLPELRTLAQNLQPENIDIPAGWEALGEFARENLPMGSAAAAGIERYGMNPESMQWLERGRQTESDIIRLASGLAVTGFELENVKKWSPWAANITKEQRTDRMRNIFNKLGREATAIGGQVWQDVSPEQFLGSGMTTTPGQIPPGGAPGQVTPPQQPPMPGPPMQQAPTQIPPGAEPRQAPPRPPGLTDDEWQQYLQLEGFI